MKTSGHAVTGIQFLTVNFYVLNSGKLNTIMAFYNNTDPPVESALTNIPVVAETGRSQMIATADGRSVPFLAKYI